MQALAYKMRAANLDKNRAGSDENAAKRDLARLMAGPDGTKLFYCVGPGGVGLRVAYESAASRVIDVPALIKLVGAERVLALCSVSIGDVERTFGKDMADRTAVTVTGNPDVRVKEEK
jgi:hypothetical protein